MSKTYLGNSGVVVMPVVDDTTTPVDNVYDLESVVLRSVNNPEGNPMLGSDAPYNWSYNSTTGYIEGAFRAGNAEGYSNYGSAAVALWLDDDFTADVTITFDRRSGTNPSTLNDTYWVTRQPRRLYVGTYGWNFNSTDGDINFNIPARNASPNTISVTLKDFDFRREYIFIYAYANPSGNLRDYYPRIISLTYKFHDHKLSPVKLKGAESN